MNEARRDVFTEADDAHTSDFVDFFLYTTYLL